MTVNSRLVELVNKYVQLNVPIDEIGYESIIVSKDEIDESLVPEKVLKKLDAEVLTHSANYEDKKGDYYLLLQLEHQDVLLHEVFLKNNEIVFMTGIGEET